MSTQSQISRKIKSGKKKLEDCSNSELRKMARFHHIQVSVDGKFLNKNQLISAISSTVSINQDKDD